MSSDSVVTAAAYGVLALVLAALLVALWRSGFLDRLLRIVEETLLGNWQLATLGAAALALSLASGYTTFDGLRNFTSAPILSVLVAFGIQGVMLIVAWLIGESFATGLNRTPRHREAYSRREALIGTGLGVMLVALTFYWALSWSGAIGFTEGAAGQLRADWQRTADVSLALLAGVVLLALFALNLRRSAVLQVYVQSARLIAGNAVLWVMFLAAMGASVFFSFDSHFSAIFPAEERARAAEIRTLNQVAGVVADIGERARKAQIAEAQRLFASDGWKAYDGGLSRLAQAARGAQAEIEAFLVSKMEERQRGIGAQQERIAAAERSRTALLRKRDEQEAELQRLEASVGSLEAELAKAQLAYDETRQAIAAKRIDASAEEVGVEGTLKRGKGPVWRQRLAELGELERKLAVADGPRLEEARRQRDIVSARIVTLRRELATLAGEIAKYASTIELARHQVEAAQAPNDAADAGSADPARLLPGFESARRAFRQQPGRETLATLQARCGALAEALAGALSAASAAGESVRGIDCDPAAAAEAAARLFALNAGLLDFQATCAGGSRLPQQASTDELLAFGRKCLQDSALASDEAADLGARLRAIEMNRDDKAHRFVVTWNAVLDGNRLAYLALALAVGIDGLVFVAGLFGAAAARSPLSDLPSPKPRSAAELEAIVRSALGADGAATAELVLGALHPAPGTDHRSEVDLASRNTGQAELIRKVLVAGRSIGAVERAPPEQGAERYLVHPELIVFLSAVAAAGRATDSRRTTRTQRAAATPRRTLPRSPSARPMTPLEIEAEAETVPPDPALTLSTSAAAESLPLITDAHSHRRRDEDALREQLRGMLRHELTIKVKAVVADVARGTARYPSPRSALARIASDWAGLRGPGLERRYRGDERALELLAEIRRDIASEPWALLRGVLDDLAEEAEHSGPPDLPRLLRRLRDDLATMDSD